MVNLPVLQNMLGYGDPACAWGKTVFQFLLKGSNYNFDLVFLIIMDSGILDKTMILMPEVLLLILTAPVYTSGNNVFNNG